MTDLSLRRGRFQPGCGPDGQAARCYRQPGSDKWVTERPVKHRASAAMSSGVAPLAVQLHVSPQTATRQHSSPPWLTPRPNQSSTGASPSSSPVTGSSRPQFRSSRARGRRPRKSYGGCDRAAAGRCSCRRGDRCIPQEVIRFRQAPGSVCRPPSWRAGRTRGSSSAPPPSRDRRAGGTGGSDPQRTFANYRQSTAGLARPCAAARADCRRARGCP